MDTVCLSVLNSILPQSWWCFSSACGSYGEFGQGGAEMAYLCFTMFGASGGTGGGDRESLLASLVPGAGGRAAD